MADLTLDEFLDSFPFFVDAPFALVEAKLKAAHEKYGWCAAFPNQYHGIIGNHAAHLLANEPGSHTLRVNGEHVTYRDIRDELLRQVPRSGSVVA